MDISICLERSPRPLRRRFHPMSAFASLALAFPVLALLALGSFGSAAPKEVTSLGRYGDWELRCVSGEPGTGQVCELVQAVVVDMQGAPLEVLRLALSPAPANTGTSDLSIVILVPGDVHLASDFGLEVDRGFRSLLRYRNCTAAGCWLVVAADAALLEALRRGLQGTGVFRMLDGQVVRVAFSLTGVTAGLEALVKAGAQE